MTKEQFSNELILYKDKYGSEMLKEFYLYWTEKNINGRKMRFEKEKTFGLSRRLATWFKNGKIWNEKRQPESASTLIQRKYGIK